MNRFLWKNSRWGSITFLVLIIACTSFSGELTSIAYDPEPYVIQEPYYFVKMVIPEDNPMTVEGVALGRHLFYDPVLSRDSSISCASCHHQNKGFTDGLSHSKGIAGRQQRRSASPIINLGYHYRNLFWDGRVKTLEEQAIHPVIDSVEMDFNWEGVTARLQNHSDYPVMFRKAFGIRKKEDINSDLVTKAIAQFERSMVSYDTKYDRVLRGEAEYTPQEFRGHQIFFDADDSIPSGECAHCHTEPLFTGLEFFNNGIEPMEDLEKFPDKGRGAVTHYLYDYGKFKTPTLRNIALTAPYMHDGRFQTLDEVVDHYISGGHFSLNVSPNVRKLKLTTNDKAALIAFLHCLTDSSFVYNENFSNPFQQ